MKKHVKRLIKRLKKHLPWHKKKAHHTDGKPGNHRYPTYRRKRRGKLKRFAISVALFCTTAVLLVVGWCYATLPDIDNLNSFNKAPSILIKAENGDIIGSFGDIYGDYIPFEQMPQSLVDAVVATEDRNFYHHFGVDPLGMLRALFADVRAGHVVQGGSTITQQVAKNVFLTPERSFTRKLKEILLALKLEHRFTKQEIMSIYLNRVYLGAGSYGIDAAAKRYFDKSARDLTLSESAIMAGLLKAPSRYAPINNPNSSRKRADQVLMNMEDAGYLTKQQAERARAELVKTMDNRKRTTQSALYFSDWIMDQLPDYIGNVNEDLVVTTTLNPDWQLLGEKAISEVMDKEGKKHNASQAALMAMTPDGAIRVMIGGRSYAESQYNRATQALRQPGSAFKLFVYLAGLEAGLTPDTMVVDQPVTIPIVGGTWTPKNYTGKYLGEIPLKEAVTESINTVAVQVAQMAGLDHVIAMARRLGITSELEAVPSIALGATEVTLLELTGAYAHLAANGAVVNPYGILEIDTSRGEPLYVRNESSEGVALEPSIVGMMDEMLLNVVENGTGRAARIGRPAAGKTGTTSDYKDAWFMGFTPDLVAGVWVGNDDNTPMKKVTGGMLPAMIWHNFMQPALTETPVSEISTNRYSVSLPWQSQPTVHTPSPSPSTLPWQTENTIPPETQNNPPQRPSPAQHGDVKLGKSFWDKLMKQ